MATYTDRYGLTKPDLDDYVDIADFNDNCDKIDAGYGLIMTSLNDFKFGYLLLSEYENMLHDEKTLYFVIDDDKNIRLYFGDYQVIGSGGGDGTDSYNNLINKPKINGNVIAGDCTSADLDIVKQLTQAEFDALEDVKPQTLYAIVG